MANSLRAKLSKLRYDGHITDAEYQAFIKKLDGYEQEIRAKAIDEFATYMSDYIYENQYGCVDDLLDRPYTTMLEIAEQMKAGGKNE